MLAVEFRRVNRFPGVGKDNAPNVTDEVCWTLVWRDEILVALLVPEFEMIDSDHLSHPCRLGSTCRQREALVGAA